MEGNEHKWWVCREEVGRKESKGSEKFRTWSIKILFHAWREVLTVEVPEVRCNHRETQTSCGKTKRNKCVMMLLHLTC